MNKEITMNEDTKFNFIELMKVLPKYSFKTETTAAWLYKIKTHYEKESRYTPIS